MKHGTTKSAGKTATPMKIEAIRPLPSMDAMDLVTDAQLARYADIIYERTGVRVSPQKKNLLSNRLRRRLRSTGVKTFEEYYKYLKSLSPKDPEWDAFIQEITTHETYLFRDESQWKWFREEFLPHRATSVLKGEALPSLRIWSAACSTGDEPYTLACCVAACLPEFHKWKIHILGTDIGLGALEQAKRGVFGTRAMRLAPEDYRRRFFSKVKEEELWQARPVLTDMLSFRQHNLMEPLRERAFDLVLLKNVLIYFSEASKTTVLHNIRAALSPGGLLVTGTAEGVADMLRDFQRLKPWLFRKPVPEHTRP
jgi:chemotaxis protein methyltransferase CheR